MPLGIIIYFPSVVSGISFPRLLETCSGKRNSCPAPWAIESCNPSAVTGASQWRCLEATLGGRRIDVLILLNDSHRVPKVKEALQKGAEKFHDLFGVNLAPYVLAATEFTDRLKKGDKLIKAMVKEARVISGKPLSEVLVDESEEKKH